MQAHTPFNRELFKSTPRCLPWLGSSPSLLYTRQPAMGICAPLFHSNLRTNSQPAPRLTPHLAHQISPLTTNASRTRGKYSRTPSYLCIATIHHSISRSTVRRRIVLGATRCSTTQTLIAPPHLTGNVPGERTELLQPLPVVRPRQDRGQ